MVDKAHQRDGDVVPYQAEHEALIADQLASVGGGGGSLGAPTWYKFDFSHDTPGLADGLDVYTPEIGDLLLDVGFVVPEVFNGTTPKADVGGVQPYGALFSDFTNSVDMSVAGAGWMAIAGDMEYMGSPNTGTTGGRFLSGVLDKYSDSLQRIVAYHRFVTTTPFKVWVTQDGWLGGAPVGGTTGEATMFFCVVRPVDLNA
jgi:hypothetical protein